MDLIWDPVNSYAADDIREQQAFLAEDFGMIDAIYQRIDSLQSIQKQVELRKAMAVEARDETMKRAARSLLEALREWQTSVNHAGA